MNKTHAAIVALLLAVAAVLGVFAATRTVGIGTAARPQTSSATIAARAHRLDRVEAALKKALARPAAGVARSPDGADRAGRCAGDRLPPPRAARRRPPHRAARRRGRARPRRGER